MSAAATTVPIQHSQVVHQVRTTRTDDARTASPAPVARVPEEPVRGRSVSGQYTLLELVEAISDVTDDEREVVVTVVHLLATGRVKLCGNFRNEPIERFLAG